MRKLGLGLAAIAAAVVVVLVVFGGGGSSDEVPAVGESEADAASLPPADQVATRVEKLRGLKFRERPRVEFISADDLTDKLEGVDREAARKLRGAAKKRAEALAAASELVMGLTGMVDPERDDTTAASGDGGVSAGGVLGLYVPERDRVYVVEELVRKDPREAEAVLAHELTHALEDQAFDGFERNPKPFADSAYARHALHEGSATLTEVMYRIEHLGSEGPVDKVIGGVRKQLVDKRAPAGLNAISAFPYADGAKFAAALHRAGKWAAVDKAHARPPKTTAAVLHPQEWPEDRHERPRFSVVDELSRDWGRLGRADVGEIDTLAMLRAGLNEADARKAAEGWEAGRFETWIHRSISRKCQLPCREDTAAVLVWRFADEAEQEEFTGAMRTALQTSTRAREVGDDALKAEDGVAVQVARGRVSSVAFAPDTKIARRLAEGALR